MNIVHVGARNHGPRRDGTPRALVLHIMAGSLAGCDLWFNDARCETSAHFGIGKDGAVHRYVDPAEAAYANGITTGSAPPDHGYAAAFLASLPAGASPNRFSISIEHEGQAGDPLDGAMFAASVELAAALFGAGGAMEGVPCDREHVLRHGEIGGHPHCPGFDEADIQRYIAAVNAALASEGNVAVNMVGLDQPATAAFIQRFVAQAADVVADNAGDGAFVVLAGLPDMKPTHDYIVLALRKQ